MQGVSGNASAVSSKSSRGKVCGWVDKFLRLLPVLLFSGSTPTYLNAPSLSPTTLFSPLLFPVEAPQGSVLGTLLFFTYTSHLGQLINYHGFHCHIYGAGTHLNLPFPKLNLSVITTLPCQTTFSNSIFLNLSW